MGSNGMPVRTDITGVDYLKAPVDEHFDTKSGQARSEKSSGEEGHAPAGSFYVSINSPAVELTLLAQQLVKAGKAGVKLYPAGEAHIEKVSGLTLEDHGKSIHVSEYAITGLAYTPFTLWLDDQLNFFGEPAHGLPFCAKVGNRQTRNSIRRINSRRQIATNGLRAS